MQLDTDTNQQLEMLLVGYQRRVADLKPNGKMPMFEGKLHLTFEGYRLLAHALLCAPPVQMLFAWPYLLFVEICAQVHLSTLLQWNLIAVGIDRRRRWDQDRLYEE